MTPRGVGSLATVYGMTYCICMHSACQGSEGTPQAELVSQCIAGTLGIRSARYAYRQGRDRASLCYPAEDCAEQRAPQLCQVDRVPRKSAERSSGAAHPLEGSPQDPFRRNEDLPSYDFVYLVLCKYVLTLTQVDKPGRLDGKVWPGAHAPLWQFTLLHRQGDVRASKGLNMRIAGNLFMQFPLYISGGMSGLGVKDLCVRDPETGSASTCKCNNNP